MVLVALAPVGARAQVGFSQVYGPETRVGASQTQQVTESSGVVASHYGPGVFWTHNDTGSRWPRLWAFGLDTAERGAGEPQVVRHLGYLELTGASHTDWEDVALGPDRMIYVFDGGDNPPCRRPIKHIHRVREPPLDPARVPFAWTAPHDTIRFEYPAPDHDGRPARNAHDRFDAECLMVHPRTGDVYVVTKRTCRGVPKAVVYALPARAIRWNQPDVHVLRFVKDLSIRGVHMVTGGAIHPSGRRLVLRNYWAAYEFDLPAETDPATGFATIFDQKPRVLPLVRQAAQFLLGEGICYTHDGRSLVMTTEEKGRTRRFEVYRIEGRLTDLTIETPGPARAVISWRTPEPTTGRLRIQADDQPDRCIAISQPSRQHRVALTDLSPATRYRYELRGDSLIYPIPGSSGLNTFETPPAHPPTAGPPSTSAQD